MARHLFNAMWLTAALFVGGCAETLTGAMTAFVVPEDRAKIKGLLHDQNRLQNFIADTTVKNWSPEHGTQVEYHSEDGRVWLVYPGNRRSVTGKWELRGSGDGTQLCYAYQKNSVNPVTGHKGGAWQCKLAVLFLTDETGEVVDGDVLRLQSRGAYPRPLPRDVNISLGTLMTELGLGPLTKPNKIAWRWKD